MTRIAFLVLPERTPLAAATQLKSRTATPIRGIAELGVHAPPNTAADEPRVASKTERNGVVHGSWTKRGEYAAASMTGFARENPIDREELCGMATTEPRCPPIRSVAFLR